ncbi:MAG: TAXI family TRAP transporter solute-binding subunit [Candidatus Rokubacteria bacterium]|nr:TAXI family TRAP transporter solute-binding subunit [Candidatus Rokubacteria bacterium]
MTPFLARGVLMAATVLLASVCLAAPATAQQKASLVFSAGPTGGTWTPMAAATADVIKKKFPELDVQVEPGAALVNMEKIRNDKADLGWSMTTVLADARAGTNTWKGKQTDRPLYVASFYPNVWQLVVPMDSDVRKLADLKGKAVALPPRGNTSLAEGWEPLLKASGMKLDDLGTKSFGSLSENGELIKNRQAVAMGWFTTVPASFILDVGSSRKLRMVPVSEDIITKMRQFNAGFVRHVIPKATYAAYGIDEDVVTIQAPTILIASSKTSPDVIYKVTKAIVEGRESFANVTAAMKGVTAKDMAQNFGLPYHPGAEKYYKEAGLVK